MGNLQLYGNVVRRIYYDDALRLSKISNKVHCADALSFLKRVPDNSFDLVITSPPYFQQRDYGCGGIGNETTEDEYINNLVLIFNECSRVVKPTGAIVFNLGDKYLNGNLSLIPFRRNGFTIIKITGNAMKKDLIESPVEITKGNKHTAVYPLYIIQELVKLLSNSDDIVLDPFCGSGTTCVAAKNLGRKYLGIEINPEYVSLSEERIKEADNHEEFFI
ncbi:MAG: site-specific DNA-methyltransferase [Endomicrobium sp.]|jgi:DNA modification methylase|nr:site-specific DNA-methyltransferase [Endomicrobium sp.]